MPLPITSVYAALLCLLFLALSIQVIRRRHATRIALGAGEDRLLERAVRAHGNAAEYLPLGILLLGLLEGLGLAGWALHGLGAALLAGRGAHAAGISREPEELRWRGLGMGLTFGMLGVGAVALLGLALGRLLG